MINCIFVWFAKLLDVRLEIFILDVMPLPCHYAEFGSCPTFNWNVMAPGLHLVQGLVVSYPRTFECSATAIPSRLLAQEGAEAATHWRISAATNKTNLMNSSESLLTAAAWRGALSSSPKPCSHFKLEGSTLERDFLVVSIHVRIIRAERHLRNCVASSVQTLDSACRSPWLRQLLLDWVGGAWKHFSPKTIRN